MRWTRVALLTRALSCGRRSRVVLTPRRWRQVSQRRLREAKVANKPGHLGEREISCKPSRAGMPGDPGATVVTNACAYYTSRTRLRVQRAPGIPRALFGRRIPAQLGRIARREREGACACPGCCATRCSCGVVRC